MWQIPAQGPSQGQLPFPPLGVAGWSPPTCLSLSTQLPLFIIPSQWGWESPGEFETGCLGRKGGKASRGGDLWAGPWVKSRSTPRRKTGRCFVKFWLKIKIKYLQKKGEDIQFIFEINHKTDEWARVNLTWKETVNILKDDNTKQGLWRIYNMLEDI